MVPPLFRTTSPPTHGRKMNPIPLTKQSLHSPRHFSDHTSQKSTPSPKTVQTLYDTPIPPSNAHDPPSERHSYLGRARLGEGLGAEEVDILANFPLLHGLGGTDLLGRLLGLRNLSVLRHFWVVSAVTLTVPAVGWWEEEVVG